MIIDPPEHLKEINDFIDRERRLLVTYESIVVWKRMFNSQLSWCLCKRLHDMGGTDYHIYRKITPEEARWVHENKGINDLFGQLEEE